MVMFMQGQSNPILVADFHLPSFNYGKNSIGGIQIFEVRVVPATLEFTSTMMVITTLLTWLSLQKRQQG